MFNKIMICLTKPSQIGMYLGEKIRKSVIQILIFSLIAIAPFVVYYGVHNNISTNSKDTLAHALMNNNLDFNLQIKDSKLIGDDGFLASTEEFILFINPNGEKISDLEVSSILTPIIEFGKDKVVVSVNYLVIYQNSYEKMGVEDIDFKKIMNLDFIEYDRFFSTVNKVYQNSHLQSVLINSIAYYLETIIMVFLSALIFSFLFVVINSEVTFRFRFKISLDCQFISLFFVLLSLLFDAYWLDFVGAFLSVVYLGKALGSIIRVEVRKYPGDKEDNE